MPAISLVVCLYHEGDLLKRMLERARGCYDDLVVVHDGPDTTNVRAIVEAAGGQFFDRPRAYQQEPHWPFAWGAAKHDWILRLDADEAPSPGLCEWLKNFRAAPELPEEISGYTCQWPLWDGRRQVTKRWPDNRRFFFNRRRVRFFGMVEQVPEPDGRWEHVAFAIEHRPIRVSYGLRYVFLRPHTANWRRVIAESLLLDSPMQLPEWRWENRPWPDGWQQIRTRPARTAFYRLLVWFPRALLRVWRVERKWMPLAVATPSLMHFLICFKYIELRRRQRKQKS